MSSTPRPAARALRVVTPTCARSARVGLLSTATGAGLVLVVAATTGYPGWLEAAASAWTAAVVAWYAFWLGRLTGQGPRCGVELGRPDDASTPSAQAGRPVPS